MTPPFEITGKRSPAAHAPQDAEGARRDAEALSRELASTPRPSPTTQAAAPSPKPHFRRPPSKRSRMTVRMPRELYELVRRVANATGMPVNAAVLSAILLTYGRGALVA